MSKKLDQSLTDAYAAVYEDKRGHAAGSSDTEKQASQLASDVRYKAKGKLKPGASDEEKKKIFLQILQSSPAPNVVKAMAKAKLLGEGYLSEEEYDRYRDEKLMRGGDHRSKETRERSYTPTGKQPKGDTPMQKKFKKKYGKKATALDAVKQDIMKKYGKGAIMDEYDVTEDKKMGRMSDDDLNAAHEKFSKMDQSMPSNKFMLARIKKEKKKREKSVQTESKKNPLNVAIDTVKGSGSSKKSEKQTKRMNTGGDGTADQSSMIEAKVDKKTPEYKRATERDERYGNPHGSLELGGGIRKDRRSDHKARRGKKTKGVKMEGMDPIKLAIAKKRGRVKEGFSAWRIDLDFNEQVKK
tara:strand:- start:685 stop:1749 length:1065 start_codon:yes stop_codon:yes gene_type:complete